MISGMVEKSKGINEEAMLFPALRYTERGNDFGYVNKEGEFIIQPRFERAYDFNSQGLAIVQEKNMMGLIDDKGEYAIQPIYGSISPFVEERAVFVLGNLMGVMDETGQVVTKKTYNFVSDYSEGRALVGISPKDDGNYIYGYIDKAGNEVIPPSFTQGGSFKNKAAIVSNKEGKFQLIDLDGNVINTYDYPYVNQYGDGLLVFAEGSFGPFGYIDVSGKIVIPPKYIMTDGFEGNVAMVAIGEAYKPNYGVINKEGEYIYKPIYANILYLEEGRLALGKQLGDQDIPFSYIYAIGTTSGEILTDFKYLAVGKYDNGIAFASNEEDTFFIDLNGELNNSLPIVRGSGTLTIKENMVFANIDYSPFYLKKDGNIIYKPNRSISLSNKYSVVRGKYKPNINYLVYYPVLMGVGNIFTERSINMRLWLMAVYNPSLAPKDKNSIFTINTESILDYSFYNDFSIIYYKNNKLVLDMVGYYYPFGAAHGMPNRKTPVINLSTGQFYKLSDVFLKESNWKEEINKLINNIIDTDPEYEGLFPGAFKGIKDNQDFYLDDENLYIYFPPYEIGPYAAGFVTFKIPWKDIETIVSKGFKV